MDRHFRADGRMVRLVSRFPAPEQRHPERLRSPLRWRFSRVGADRVSVGRLGALVWPRGRHGSEAVDVDRGQLVGRHLNRFAVVMSLDELAPVGRWAPGGCGGWPAAADRTDGFAGPFRPARSRLRSVGFTARAAARPACRRRSAWAGRRPGRARGPACSRPSRAAGPPDRRSRRTGSSRATWGRY